MTMSEDMPLLSEQELRTHDVRIYRPHTTVKKPAFDWDALTPTCKSCGEKSGQLNSDSLCPKCRPHLDPAPAPASAPRTTRRQPSTRPRAARPGSKGGRIPKPIDAEAVAAAFRDGESVVSIAVRLGVARLRVRQIVVDAGEEMHRGRRGHARQLDEQAVVDAYKAGQSISQICDALDYHNRTRIRDIIVGAGVELRQAADEQAIVEAYQGGQSIAQICVSLGTTNRNRVRQVLMAAGVEIRMPRGGNPAGRSGKPVDERAIVEEYRAGDSAPKVAERHGILAKRVRAIVERHGVELRDDRATHSGSTPKVYDPALCLAVERLYVREGLSQGEVGERLGISRKVVDTIMRRRGVRARQNQTGHQDGAVQLKAQISRLDVTPRTIKLWALHVGLIETIGPGIPSQAVVDAYEAAHGGDE